MRVFLAGASGAIGKPLIAVLVKAGHEVIGMTRSPHKRELVESLGGKHVAADALDSKAVMREIQAAQPDVIIHEMTAIPQALNFRRFDEQFALTNRLRAEGTDNLLAAGRAVGARKFIAQSYAGWPYERVGGPIKTEDDPLDPNHRTYSVAPWQRYGISKPWSQGLLKSKGLCCGTVRSTVRVLPATGCWIKFVSIAFRSLGKAAQCGPSFTWMTSPLRLWLPSRPERQESTTSWTMSRLLFLSGFPGWQE